MDNEQEKQIKKGKKNKFKKVINITSILMFISFLFLSYSILLISGVETELRYIGIGILLLINLIVIFVLNFIFLQRVTVRFCARPCLWQGSCVSAPRCGFASQTREILLCASAHVPACGRDRKGRGACVFACKNTGGLCRSPGEPGFCAVLRNKKPPGLFLVLFFF